jgi:putative SOS response-associated peptidase YedK
VDDLLADFEAEFEPTETWMGHPDPVPADYNVAPTKPVPVVATRRRSGDRTGPVLRQVRVVSWGLVPSWAKDAAGAARRINARAETVAELPAFRSALARRRCLVPADGWYEWAPRPDGPGRQPYYLTRPDGAGLAFAGLYEFWSDPDGRRLTTCTIVTTAAVGALTAVHTRMPLLLPRSAWAAWLDPAVPAPAGLLAPPPAELVAELEVRPVGSAVGNVANAGPELVAAVPPAPVAQPLF